jgi:prevent-host-death family protein
MTKRTLKKPLRSLSRKQVIAKTAVRGAVRTLSKKPATNSPRRSIPATEAKNRFGEILLAARESGPVFIERHGRAQAVLLGIDAYNKLASNERTPQERELDYWTREFTALHSKMQSQKARHAVDALFSATDAELNRKDA